MPTLLFLNLYGTIGGAERATLELVDALDRQRFTPVAALAADGPFGDELRRRGVGVEPLSVPTPPLWQLVLPWVLVREAAASLRLLRLVRRRRVRVVHCGDVLSLLLLLPARAAGVRVLYQVHFLGRGLRVAAFNLLALVAADVVVAYSADQRDALGAATLGLAGRTQVVHPGLEPSVFAGGDGARVRREVGIPDTAPLVGMLARYDTWKGHRVFLDAADRIRAARPDARFLVAGGALNRESLPHVARCEAAFLARRRELGLEDVVTVVGHRPDVAAVLAALDVLVCPSEREAFGMVVLEALAAGTPVVAADSGGPREILEPDRSGLLFATGDAVSLADQVLRLLGDPALGGRLAEAGTARVADAFSRGRYARDIVALYERLA